jgi:arginine-tRNA-protein transferase
MYTEIHYPINRINAERLDAYLESGWFRMGQTIFTCWFLFMEKGFFSAIWIRQDLKDFKFKKRLRKLMNRNGRIFRIEVGVAKIDAKKERLYQKHRVRFSSGVHRTLNQSLMAGANFSIYDTKQIEIYLDDTLVAASFFDVGHKSIASISGIFDPAYDQYSLGFYTMLLEMQYAIEQGKEFYYPGYVVPGNPRFDYKARIGPVDYYDFYTKEWKAYASLERKNIPSKLLRGKLNLLQFYLKKLNIISEIFLFPPYESSGIDPFLEDLLEHPMYLKIYSDKFIHFELFGVYDLVKQQYKLGIYYNLDDFSDWVAANQLSGLTSPSSYNIYILGETLLEDVDASLIAKAAHEFIF